MCIRDRTVTDSLAQLLTTLRAIEPVDIAGWGYWTSDGIGGDHSWTDYLLAIDQDLADSRVHGWKPKLRSDTVAAARFDRGLDQLRECATDHVPRSLVHNDLFNRNALVEAGQITGVFDWGECADW